ncbi:MAG: cytochrome [Pseudonocardiales bacterium]|nr:cytochrome [Pseudonocardiales bacterium]
MHVRPGHDEMEWIRDFTEADEILKSKQFRNTLHDGPARWIIGDTLGTLHGDTHTYRRRTEMMIFSRQALMSYELELIRPALREGLAGVLEETGTASIPIQSVMRGALLRISARIVGLDVVSDDDTEALRSMSERVGEGTASEWLTEGVDEVVANAVAAKEEFRQRFFIPARDRRLVLLERVAAVDLAADELPNDLLLLLLKAYDDWEEDKMLRECIFYLGASASTTSQAAPHVLFEILDWVSHHPEDADKVHDSVFLRAAVHETLRLHPPAPALMRAALEDVELSTGRVLTAGVNFALDLNAVNRREEVFGPDAAEFNPYRVPVKGVHGYGESFGAGPHVCPGRLIAVGAAVATGKDSDTDSIGVLVRLMEELFRYEVALDPADPPTRRGDTLVDRYERFNVLITRVDEARV